MRLFLLQVFSIFNSSLNNFVSDDDEQKCLLLDIVCFAWYKQKTDQSIL